VTKILTLAKVRLVVSSATALTTWTKKAISVKCGLESTNKKLQKTQTEIA